MARTMRLPLPASSPLAVWPRRTNDTGLAAALVLLPVRLFLALIWGRAAIEKSIDAGWWSGDELRSALREEQAGTVPIFEPVLERVVGPVVVAVAVALVAAQLACAVAFATGRHLRLALFAAITMNVCFVLAGRVNPSIFYLVMELTLVIAITGGVIGGRRPRSPRWTAAFAIASFGAAGALAPSVRTLRPTGMLGDPALVLVTAFGLVGLCLALQLVVHDVRLGDRRVPIVRWVLAADDPTPPAPDDVVADAHADDWPDSVSFGFPDEADADPTVGPGLAPLGPQPTPSAVPASADDPIVHGRSWPRATQLQHASSAPGMPSPAAVARPLPTPPWPPPA